MRRRDRPRPGSLRQKERTYEQRPVRTAVDRFGALRDVPAETVAAAMIKETVERSGIDPKLIEDVVMGQWYANSEAHVAGGRLRGGTADSVAGLQVSVRDHA